MNRPLVQSFTFGRLLSVAVITALLVALLITKVTTSHDPPAPFTPPDRVARRQAVGSLVGLPKEQRLAFAPADPAFQPIPVPGASDWLSQHFESGQTYEQYKHSDPNRLDSVRNKLYFQPIGDFSRADAPQLEQLREFASAFFAMTVTINPPVKLEGLPIESRQRDFGKQLLSTDVLDWLRGKVPDDAYCLLAITMEDLYPDPKWNFVFGQASIRDRVGGYSFARYHPEFYGKNRLDEESVERLVLLRSCKVLAHETGHMFGIKHCVHFHCLMNGSNHLQESDAQPIHLCPVCLRKFSAANPGDLVQRYRSLQTFAQQVGWQSENDWLKSRLSKLSD